MRITKQQHPSPRSPSPPRCSSLTAACGTAGPGGGAAPGPDPAPPPLHGVHWTVDSVTVDGARTSAPTRTPHVEFSPAPPALPRLQRVHVRGRDQRRHRPPHRADPDGTGLRRAGPAVRGTAGADPHRRCPPHGARRRPPHPAYGGRRHHRAQRGAARRAHRHHVDGGRPARRAGRRRHRVRPARGHGGLAHLTLGADGRARGSLGCNTFTAEVTVTESPGTLVFSRIATTRKLCGRPLRRAGENGCSPRCAQAPWRTGSSTGP